jgi:RHS repeat-associated protein
LFEDLEYQYNWLNDELLQNRLYHVNDAISASPQDGDIEDQGTFYDPQNQIKTDNNYLYTAIGELQVDKSEDIEEIVWRVDSKIAEVRRTNNSTKKNLRFDYDAMGNRIAKHIYADNQFTDWEKSTYYVRDASGNVMAVYDRLLNDSTLTGDFICTERHIYGSSRIGMNTYPDTLTPRFSDWPIYPLSSTTRELGHKQYEISNHLGNVLSVITDQKLPVVEASLVVSYSAVIITATDYSPFGVGLYGRSWSEGYRYGFNGQERIYEINEGGINYDFGARVFNAPLGKFLSIDPLCKRQVSVSPYVYALSSPTIYIDRFGEDPILGQLVIISTGQIALKLHFKSLSNEGAFHDNLLLQAFSRPEKNPEIDFRKQRLEFKSGMVGMASESEDMLSSKGQGALGGLQLAFEIFNSYEQVEIGRLERADRDKYNNYLSNLNMANYMISESV